MTAISIIFILFVLGFTHLTLREFVKNGEREELSREVTLDQYLVVSSIFTTSTYSTREQIKRYMNDDILTKGELIMLLEQLKPEDFIQRDCPSVESNKNGGGFI